MIDFRFLSISNAESLNVAQNLNLIDSLTSLPQPTRVSTVVRFDDSDEEEKALNGSKLVRHSTPHPKDLRAIYEKLLQDKEQSSRTQGREAQQQVGQHPPQPSSTPNQDQ